MRSRSAPFKRASWLLFESPTCVGDGRWAVEPGCPILDLACPQRSQRSLSVAARMMTLRLGPLWLRAEFEGQGRG